MHFKMLSAICFNLDQSKILSSGNGLNSLANSKMLKWSNFKHFPDDIINVTIMMNFVAGRVENIAGKGENAGYQHFLLFPQCFQKASLSRSLKFGIVL